MFLWASGKQFISTPKTFGQRPKNFSLKSEKNYKFLHFLKVHLQTEFSSGLVEFNLKCTAEKISLECKNYSLLPIYFKFLLSYCFYGLGKSIFYHPMGKLFRNAQNFWLKTGIFMYLQFSIRSFFPILILWIHRNAVFTSLPEKFCSISKSFSLKSWSLKFWVFFSFFQGYVSLELVHFQKICWIVLAKSKVSRKKFFNLFSFQRLIFLQKFPLETWNSVSTTLTNYLFLPKSWKLFAQILQIFKVSIVSKILFSPFCSSAHVEYKIHVTPGNNLPKIRNYWKVIMFFNFFPRMFLWARKKAIFSSLPENFRSFSEAFLFKFRKHL